MPDDVPDKVSTVAAVVTAEQRNLSRISRIGKERNSTLSKQAALAMHKAICQALGVRLSDEASGAKSTAARLLGVRTQRYTEATSGTRGSLPSVCNWFSLWNASQAREARGLPKLQLVWDGTHFEAKPLED